MTRGRKKMKDIYEVGDTLDLNGRYHVVLSVPGTLTANFRGRVVTLPMPRDTYILMDIATGDIRQVKPGE